MSGIKISVTTRTVIESKDGKQEQHSPLALANGQQIVVPAAAEAKRATPLRLHDLRVAYRTPGFWRNNPENLPQDSRWDRFCKHWFIRKVIVVPSSIIYRLWLTNFLKNGILDIYYHWCAAYNTNQKLKHAFCLFAALLGGIGAIALMIYVPFLAIAFTKLTIFHFAYAGSQIIIFPILGACVGTFLADKLMPWNPVENPEFDVFLNENPDKRDSITQSIKHLSSLINAKLKGYSLFRVFNLFQIYDLDKIRKINFYTSLLTHVKEGNLKSLEKFVMDKFERKDKKIRNLLKEYRERFPGQDFTLQSKFREFQRLLTSIKDKDSYSTKLDKLKDIQPQLDTEQVQLIFKIWKKAVVRHYFVQDMASFIESSSLDIEARKDPVLPAGDLETLDAATNPDIRPVVVSMPQLRTVPAPAHVVTAPQSTPSSASAQTPGPA